MLETAGLEGNTASSTIASKVSGFWFCERSFSEAQHDSSRNKRAEGQGPPQSLDARRKGEITSWFQVRMSKPNKPKALHCHSSITASPTTSCSKSPGDQSVPKESQLPPGMKSCGPGWPLKLVGPPGLEQLRGLFFIGATRLRLELPARRVAVQPYSR